MITRDTVRTQIAGTLREVGVHGFIKEDIDGVCSLKSTSEAFFWELYIVNTNRILYVDDFDNESTNIGEAIQYILENDMLENTMNPSKN